MSEIKNKIITISGEPASGKSTVVKALKEKYENMGYTVHIISTGQVFREIIKKEYLKMYPDRTDANLADIQTDEEFAKKRNEIDSLIDGEMAKRGEKINSKERPDDVYIIDSRLAWKNIPTSYAIRLTIDEKIAGKRVFNDSTRGSEDEYQTVEEAIEKTRQRKLGEISRYKERYRVDLANPENYNLIIDTSYSNIDELAQIIINGEKTYRSGRYYPKTWASPLHFLPVQNPRNLECRTPGQRDTVAEICDSIKQNGYDPILGEIDVDEYDGALYIRDGNHRTFAALSAGLTLVPYYVYKTQDNVIPIGISDPDYLGRLYDWIEGVEYYGGKLGNIEQLKRLDVVNLSFAEKIPVISKKTSLDTNSGDGR